MDRQADHPAGLVTTLIFVVDPQQEDGIRHSYRCRRHRRDRRAIQVDHPHQCVAKSDAASPVQPDARGRRIDDKTRAAMIAAFTIEPHRAFDQDPRLGLIALSEIAGRALAPATNDPGIAIEVLERAAARPASLATR